MDSRRRRMKRARRSRQFAAVVCLACLFFFVNAAVVAVSDAKVPVSTPARGGDSKKLFNGDASGVVVQHIHVGMHVVACRRWEIQSPRPPSSASPSSSTDATTPPLPRRACVQWSRANVTNLFPLPTLADAEAAEEACGQTAIVSTTSASSPQLASPSPPPSSASVPSWCSSPLVIEIAWATPTASARRHHKRRRRGRRRRKSQQQQEESSDDGNIKGMNITVSASGAPGGQPFVEWTQLVDAHDALCLRCDLCYSFSWHIYD